MAIATQFCLRGRARSSPGPTGWPPRASSLPIHIGVAGPAKLQTLLKFAIACGVGPSLKVLQKRAKDVTRSCCCRSSPTSSSPTSPPTRRAHPDFGIEAVHFFPLGGIKTNAAWTQSHGGASGIPAAQA